MTCPQLVLYCPSMRVPCTMAASTCANRCTFNCHQGNHVVGRVSMARCCASSSYPCLEPEPGEPLNCKVCVLTCSCFVILNVKSSGGNCTPHQDFIGYLVNIRCLKCWLCFAVFLDQALDDIEVAPKALAYLFHIPASGLWAHLIDVETVLHVGVTDVLVTACIYLAPFRACAVGALLSD
uniref:Uncharacterized protein n=1 Tax=Babesia bovis TaxID=5865 RepID=A7AMN7_BABBO|eukprot:XP_001611389.1 hypothetical protein [Babesia bovis T2Bo]